MKKHVSMAIDAVRQRSATIPDWVKGLTVIAVAIPLFVSVVWIGARVQKVLDSWLGDLTMWFQAEIWRWATRPQKAILIGIGVIIVLQLITLIVRLAKK